MAKKAGSKAGEAFVELGLDRNPLVQSLASAQTTFTTSLKTMAAQAAKFGSSLGVSLGALGGGAGIGAAIGALAKRALALEDALLDLAIQSGLAGRKFSDMQDRVNRMLPTLQRLFPVTFKQALAIEALGVKYNLAGEELDKFQVRALALARFSGLDPVTAAKGLIKGITEPSPAALETFGIPALPPGPNVVNLIRPRLLEVADGVIEAAKAAMKLPSSQIDSIKANVSDWFDALGEAAVEAVLDVADKPPEKSAGKQGQLSKIASGAGNIIAKGAVTAFNNLTAGPRFAFGVARRLLGAAGLDVGESQSGAGKAGASLVNILERGGTGKAVLGEALEQGGRIIDALPSAEELRGRSQRTESLLEGVAAASTQAQSIVDGLTPEERAARAGDFSPRSLILSDEERAQRNLNSANDEVVPLLREIRDRLPEAPGELATPFQPVGPGIEPFP